MASPAPTTLGTKRKEELEVDNEPAAKRVKDDFASEITLGSPMQRDFGGVQVPLVIKCNDDKADDAAVAKWVLDNQSYLEEKLRTHGAILFRGFPLATALNFDSFVRSFDPYGWQDLSYEDSLSFAVRLQVTGRVCTTNEGKNGGMVFHHEQAQTPKFPSKVMFYCLTTGTEGGGTGVCPSFEVLKRLEASYPAFVRRVEDKGVKYIAYLRSEPDASKGVGRGWKEFFGKVVKTKEECEARMAELGYTWEWQENDQLKATTPKLAAVSVAPGTKTRVYFNQLPATIANAREWSDRSDADKISDTDLPVGAIDRFLTFGDGSTFDKDDCEALLFSKKLTDECAVELKWEQGDVGLLDNILVMHARRRFEGPRKVLASLFQ